MSSTEASAASEAPAAQVYRKVARRLVPFLFLCYVVAYLDRVNVGFAKLQLQDELWFSNTVYGLGAGIFFLGYILFEVPSNVILHRIGARVWIARIMLTWGILSAATMFVNSAPTFYVMRFLLGVAEAGFIPGILLYLTYWFPAQRRGRIFALFLAAIPVATVFGGPLSGWILEGLSGTAGLRGWQWLFLIEAVPALLLGVAVLLRLDDNVDAARWLTDAEKRVVKDGVAAEQHAKPGTHDNLRQVLRSKRIWLLGGIYFCIALGLYTISFWLPTIVKDSGVDSPLAVGLLSALPYLVAVVAMVLVAGHSDRSGERRWHTAAPCLITGVSLVLVAPALHSTLLAMIALTLAAAGVSTTQAAFWTLPSAFLSGVGAAAGIALVNSIGNISGMISTSLVGWLTDLTGSTASSLYLFGALVVLGGLLVLRLPRELVNDRAEPLSTGPSTTAT